MGVLSCSLYIPDLSDASPGVVKLSFDSFFLLQATRTNQAPPTSGAGRSSCCLGRLRSRGSVARLAPTSQYCPSFSDHTNVVAGTSCRGCQALSRTCPSPPTSSSSPGGAKDSPQASPSPTYCLTFTKVRIIFSRIRRCWQRPGGHGPESAPGWRRPLHSHFPFGPTPLKAPPPTRSECSGAPCTPTPPTAPLRSKLPL